MKKTVFILMSVLLSLGTFCACSSDDDIDTPEAPETGHGTRQLPKQADFVKTVTEIGYMTCDAEDGTWIIDVPTPVPPGEVLIDGGTFYYLYDLPEEFQKKGLKVKATVDAYTFRHFDEKVEITTYAGWDYFDAVLRDIEIVE